MARCQNDVVVPKEERIAGYWYPDSCPEVVVIEEVAQRQLPLTTAEENSLLCGKGCEESTLSRDILNFYNSLPTCLEEAADDIFYWDQSGAVMMDSTDFCTSWKEMSVTIVVVRGRLYSTIKDLMDGSGASVKICTMWIVTSLMICIGSHSGQVGPDLNLTKTIALDLRLFQIHLLHQSRLLRPVI